MKVKISGKAYGFVTMPGILIHELAHYFACVVTRTEVLQFSYNDFSSDKDYLGFVVHRQPKNYFAEFLIPVAPLVFNVLVANLVAIPLWSSWDSFHFRVWHYPLLYLSLTIAIHGVPSAKDNENLFHASLNALQKYNPFALVGLALACTIGALNAVRAIAGLHFSILVMLDFFLAFAVMCAGVEVGRAAIVIPAVNYSLWAAAAALITISVAKRRELAIFARSLASEAAGYLLLSIAVSVLIPAWIWLVLEVGVFLGMIIIIGVLLALFGVMKGVSWLRRIFAKHNTVERSAPTNRISKQRESRADFYVGPDGVASPNPSLLPPAASDGN